jgi:alpha-mannosidase
MMDNRDPTNGHITHREVNIMTTKYSSSRREFILKAAATGAAGAFWPEDLPTFFSGNDDKAGNRIDVGSSLMADSAARDTFWFIVGTHWEGAVFKTREQYLDIGLPNILTALRLLHDYPEYRFTLDQVCYVKPFLERYPEEAIAFRHFVQEGRLQIAGGTNTMMDTNIPGGESIVRQMLYGKSYFREELGVDVTTGWALDTFGHNAQMPQLLKLAGYTSYWFQRGVPNKEVPSEWLWEGIDGTQIPAFYLPLGYGLLVHTPDTIDEFITTLKKRFDSLTPWSHGHDRVGLASPDVEEPVESVPLMVREFERRDDKPFNLRLALPRDFEGVINLRTDRTVIKGELNPIFQGAYSSRIELKQKLRNVERLLTTAEKLGVLGNWLGRPTTEEKVWSAWEPSLFNQAHDLMAGVMTDNVYDDTIRGYDFSTRLGKEIVDDRLEYLASQVDTSGEGIPLVVFNPLGWQRDDVVETTIGFHEGGIVDIQVADQANRVIPVEIVEAERFRDGGLKNAKIIFIAREVPALGHAVYRVIPLTLASGLNASRETSDGMLENEYYQAEVDLSTGAITSLKVKSDNWEVLDKAGNVVVHQYDGGDLWELYENLTASSNIRMTRKQAVPQESVDQFSTEYSGERAKVHRGPVYSEYRLAPHRFCAEGVLSTTVRTYAGVRRIEMRTMIQNNEKYVRYQVLFPTTIVKGQTVHEIPFGSIERPNGIEFPAQTWADYNDGKRGLALLNRGLPGNLTSDSTMMLSLMRSARIASYGYGGGYERGMSSDTGLMLGSELEFDYALVPHTGDWRQGEVYRNGIEYNNPLLCLPTGTHTGKLSRSWGLLEVSKPNVVITALKPGMDGSVILRLYEASGKTTPGVIISSNAKIGSAFEANLIEDTRSELKVTRDTLRIDFRPFEIRTLKLRLRV